MRTDDSAQFIYMKLVGVDKELMAWIHKRSRGTKKCPPAGGWANMHFNWKLFLGKLNALRYLAAAHKTQAR